MSRTDRLFKKSFNDALDLIAGGGEIASISGLARDVGVSRTTARRIIERSGALGIVARDGETIAIARPPRRKDYFPADETEPIDDVIRSAFMNWLSRQNVAPGTSFSEIEFARGLGVPASAVREFLLRFSRFQLVRRQSRQRWVFTGFTRAYAEELHELRALFELRSINRILEMEEDASIWQDFERLRDEHADLKDRVDKDYLEFSVLDARFHSTIFEASGNRFFTEFRDVISFIFHYRYGWDRQSAKQRNAVAIDDHLRFLDAVIAGDRRGASAAMHRHLKTARKTMLQSVEW